MPSAVATVSAYFGPQLVKDGPRRVSFAEAWSDPELRMRAVRAANRALNAKQRPLLKKLRAGAEEAKAESDQLSLITNLLLDLLMEEGGVGSR